MKLDWCYSWWVLFVVGILVAVFLPQFTSGIKDKALASQLVKQVNDYAINIKAIADSCNIAIGSVIDHPTRYTTLNAPTTTYFAEIMVYGSAKVATAKKYCYNQANVKFNNYIDIGGYANSIGGIYIPQNKKLLILPMQAGLQVTNVTWEVASHVIKALNLNPDDFPYVDGAMYYTDTKLGMTIYSSSNVTLLLRI